MSKLFLRKVALSFARSFLAFFVPGLAGAYNPFITGDVAASKAALIALVAGSITAGLRAAQIGLTTWETPK